MVSRARHHHNPHRPCGPMGRLSNSQMSNCSSFRKGKVTCPRSHLELGPGLGWNPGLCWRHAVWPGFSRDGTSGRLPPTVWGHDTHPGGEDELYWPVPAWIRGTTIHGPPTFQAVSAPWNRGGWKASPFHPCRAGRASWDLLGEPLRVPQDWLEEAA